MEEDVRDPAYQAAHPEMRPAVEFLVGLTPMNFLRLVRYVVEMRSGIDEQTHILASKHYTQITKG